MKQIAGYIQRKTMLYETGVEYGDFEFRPGAAMCNVLLADEINRTSPKTQSALLQIMEEGMVSVDGVTYKLPEPFFVIATENPYGSAGTQKLPESQLDRFMIRTSIGYPVISDEAEILKLRSDKRNARIQTRRVLSDDDLKGLFEAVNSVYVHDDIYRYVAKFAAATRGHATISCGLSPRGSICLISMAKAHAFFDGRDYVIPLDIHEILHEVVDHRIVRLSSLGSNGDNYDIVEQIIREVPVPSIS